MKAINVIIILIFYNGYTQTVLTDLYIPEKVEINKDVKYIHYPSSNLSIAIPEDYKYAYNEFIKENDVHIRVYPKNKRSFSDNKAVLKDWAEKTRQKGFSVFEKEFKLGNHEAYLIYYNYKIEGKIDEISLMLKNGSFTEIIGGKFPRDKINAQKEVLPILLTSHIDDRQSPNYSPSDVFSIDCTNTDFKFHSNLSSNDFIYTPNGEGSLVAIYQDLIQITTLTPIKTPEEGEKNLQDIIKYYKNSCYKINKWTKKIIKINGQNGYEMVSKCNYQKVPMSIYLIVLNNEKATINYTAIIYHNQDNLFIQAQKLAQTLHIKN